MECHKETPCRAILNKQKHHFSKMGNKKVLLGGGYQWEGGGYKERV
jgi:hypothetical protein